MMTVARIAEPPVHATVRRAGLKKASMLVEVLSA
jgi:hypothetical protein